jgi:hypothetical protein
VEKLLHGYDEEEICYALRMCPWSEVRVWRPGKPTRKKSILSKETVHLPPADENINSFN